MTDGERIDLDLTEDERYVLRCGLVEWGGPAHCTHEMAVAMGFDSVQDLFAQSDVLVPKIMAGEPLSAADWCRVLLATEICFSSNLIGSGHDWMFTTGLSDEKTLSALRRIQKKVPRDVYAVVGDGIGTRRSRSDFD